MQAEKHRHPSPFGNKSRWAVLMAFDRIHDISKYIKIRKEIIKMGIFPSMMLISQSDTTRKLLILMELHEIRARAWAGVGLAPCLQFGLPRLTGLRE